MERNEYFLGLDMGTSSVGWAVTNDKYELIRKKGKDMWGIREFDEASPAVDRRNNRIARRRNERSKIRMGLVKNYFSAELEKVDAGFLVRLENSKYHMEDKEENARCKYVLFNDSDYSDVEYFEAFPTIFHLRKELIENKSAHDIRLVYLAVINMFKRRGHFLNESLDDAEETRNIQSIYSDFCEMYENNLPDENYLTFPDANNVAEKLAEILGDKDLSRTMKNEAIAEFMGIPKKDARYEYIKAICGLSVDAKKLFSDIDVDEKVNICFNDFAFDEKIPDLMAMLGDSRFEIIAVMKELYDAGILSGILKGYKYISCARVDEYEKHKSDLSLLKDLYKKYKSKDEYDAMFRSSEAGSYGAYVNSVNSDHIKQRRDMGGNAVRNVDAFYKRVKSELKSITNDDVIGKILSDIDNGTFMPKQLTASNGVIPNQVHKKELKKILKNAEAYLPFLTEKDSSGKTVSERIIALFEFQIPYFIGPLSVNSSKNGGNGWVVRKESGQVLPWNIYDKVDKEESATAFISRMVRECTYLRGEKVLPKASLEYEAYCVLNEINNICIDGNRIPVELKQSIYKELFQKGKKVTRKHLEDFLKGRGALEDSTQLTGIDININNALTSFGKFKSIFGDRINEDGVQKLVEQIIYYGTIFGSSKNMFKDKLQAIAGEMLSEGDIKRILGFKFKDWGRLSKNFLELNGCNVETGEVYSLIRAMWENNLNLMEIINSEQFTFKQELEKRRENAIKKLTDIKYEDLDGYYFSAPVKRMVWQTMLLVQEITAIMGNPPKKIFLEMTRLDGEKGDKGRTNSRKKQLLELYKSINDDMCNWKELIEREDASGRLKSKKMYLYITQMGRDMYTGEPIDLERLFNDNLYDIDHIYPRNFVKDDNINNNLVLVDKTLNNRKQNYYPLDSSISSNQKVRNLWRTLHEKKLITDEKYQRLTSRNELTDEQKAGFIARQLVETSQATKGIADIIKSLCEGTEIVYSKAGNVSDFRHEYNLVKSRLVNDFHHAHDAYLNIVVGNAYNVKFTANPRNFIMKEYAKDKEKYRYHLGKMFERDIVRGNEIGWIAGTKDNSDHGTIITVKRMLNKNTPLMTRMNFEGHGSISNATIYSANKATREAYIPLKSADGRMLDVKKYGGYTSASTAYFTLVESENKGKKIRTIEAVPIYMLERIKKDKNELIKYLEEKLNLVNPCVRLEKIKIQSLIKLNGFYVYISGKTGNRLVIRNAVNLCVKQNIVHYIKKIENYEKTGSVSNDFSREMNILLYDELMKKHSEDIFSKRPNAIGEKLKIRKDDFVDLDVARQVKVLYQIIFICGIGNVAADLSLLKEAAISGKMLMSKKIDGYDEVILINQSLTGIYVNQKDLLKV